MLAVRAPILHRADITDLCPTQISVGMREVEDKRHRWGRRSPARRKSSFKATLFPLSPAPREGTTLSTIITLCGHYTKRAWPVYVTPVVDLSRVEKDAFWVVLDSRGLMSLDDQGSDALTRVPLE